MKALQVRKYKVTKQHLTGNLKGLSTTENTPILFELGRVYSCCGTGSKYRIVRLKEALQC